MTSLAIKLALAAAALWPAVGLPGVAEARSRPPLHNPALLNIGFVCRWQPSCIRQQQREMRRALAYVKKHKPPAWKIQLCNRNSSRNGTRKDWVGFNNCIRNPALRRPPAPRRRVG
jgi:hypothetical protein